MAMPRYAATSSLLGGTRYAQNTQENTAAEKMLGKSMITGKPRLTNNSNRTALGNISNRTTTANVLQKPALKDGPTKSHKPAATKPLKPVPVVKENVELEVVQKPVEERVPPPCLSPAPMDISANSQSDAFSSKNIAPINVQDIDKEDKENPQLVSEYVNEIYDYMRMLEEKFNVEQRYLDKHEINGRMRGILIDWLVQVHLRFHLLQETLYLTVAIIDRFLQVQSVSRSKLQLVGVTSMLVASKYEEMYAPEISDFVYITDNAYSKADIRKMECFILRTLDFNLGRPLPLHFLRRNSKAGEVDAQKHTLAKYLMELTIVDYEMVHLAPSVIAASALCLSMKVLDGSNWTDTLSHYSKYSETDLMPIMRKMSCLVMKAGSGKLTSIKTKYTSSKLMKISCIPELKSQTIQDLARGNGGK